MFSVVVMYKPMAQHTCPLHNAVNNLCECAQDKKPSLAFFSLSEATSYFSYPEAADHVDYALIPVNNVMTWVIGSTSDYIVGQLLHMIEGDVMNIVLPPAFGINAKTQDFDGVPHPICGGMWSNYQLVDPLNGDENFTHMVPVASLDVFRVNLGDQVHQSALGFWVEPLPMLTYTTDLTRCRYKVASQFTSALQQGKSLATAAAAGMTVTTGPINAESAGRDVVLEDNPTGTSTATAKCKIKSSTKNLMAATDDSQGADEMEVTTDVATVAGSSDPPTSLPVNSPMLNQAHQMVCHLFIQSNILDECRVCLAQAVSTAASQQSTELSLPFMSYLSAISDAVEAWHTNGPISGDANCDYNTYRGCAADRILWKTA